MKVNIQIIIYTVAPFLVIALIYFLAVRISKWNKNKTEKRLKSISVTAETEIK
jgi:large-conductance mechanosensitive channel